MAHLLFYLFVVAACLLWSAAFVAAAARTERTWVRGVLAAVAVVVPPLALVPWVGVTAGLAGLKLETNWFVPTVTAFLAAVVGGPWIAAAGLSRRPPGGGRVAAAWPVAGLAALFVMAKAVAFGTLLCIDAAVAARARALRVEAAQIVAATLPPPPSADDDAAPLYVRAFAALEADTSLSAPESPVSAPLALSADPASPAVAEVLARHAATLDLLRRAADRPDCRFVRDWSRPSLDMLLPEIQSMRLAVRLLALEARRAAAAGDAAAGIRDVVRMHRIAVHAASEPILVSGLVGLALDAVAMNTLVDILPRLERSDLPLLDDPALRDAVDSPLAFLAHLLGEEAFGLATLADLADPRTGTTTLDGVRALSDEQPLGSVLDAPLSLLYRTFLLPADITGYQAILGRYRVLAWSMAGPSRASYAEIRTQLDEIEETLRHRRAGLFSAIMAPALTNVVQAQFKGRVRHEAAGVLMAATRARLKSGSAPESIDALVPGFLAAVPRDPFTADAPLRWKRDGDEILVYSVGPDGEDDGGPTADPGSLDEGDDDVGLRLVLPAAKG